MSGCRGGSREQQNLQMSFPLGCRSCGRPVSFIDGKPDIDVRSQQQQQQQQRQRQQQQHQPEPL